MWSQALYTKLRLKEWLEMNKQQRWHVVQYCRSSVTLILPLSAVESHFHHICLYANQFMRQRWVDRGASSFSKLLFVPSSCKLQFRHIILKANLWITVWALRNQTRWTYGQPFCTLECSYLIILLFLYWVSGTIKMPLCMLQHFSCAVEIKACEFICIFTRDRSAKIRLNLILCSK